MAVESLSDDQWIYFMVIMSLNFIIYTIVLLIHFQPTCCDCCRCCFALVPIFDRFSRFSTLTLAVAFEVFMRTLPGLKQQFIWRIVLIVSNWVMQFIYWYFYHRRHSNSKEDEEVEKLTKFHFGMSVCFGIELVGFILGITVFPEATSYPFQIPLMATFIELSAWHPQQKIEATHPSTKIKQATISTKIFDPEPSSSTSEIDE
jgi:hypothetical protein